MKSALYPRLVFVAVSLALFCLDLSAADTNSPREKLLLDANWKFHLGNEWGSALNLSKAASSSGPAAQKFNDASWRTVNLPHDWVVELPFDKNSDMSHGYKPVGPGFASNNIAWYRRTFDLSKEDAGKRLWLEFDGVYRDCTVFVNGWLVGHHEGGYNGFRYDITDVANVGGKNTVAVRVDASQFEGWFYEGAGIYRHTWLVKTAPVAIAPDGVFVYSKFEPSSVLGGAVSIHIKATIQTVGKNSREDQFSNGMPSDGIIQQELFDPNGKQIATLMGKSIGGIAGIAADGNYFTDKQVGIYKQREIYTSFLMSTPGEGRSGNDSWAPDVMVIHKPILWSPESPNLYKLVTTVQSSQGILDRVETEFGIRNFAFDKDKGFLLNGQPYEIKGTCNHQDMAGVGAALPDGLQYFRIAKLKEMGDNAYRTSHNPPTPELLEACDRLGMLVLDENRIVGSDAENLQKLEDQIRRDRNHASVFAWSLGNEEWGSQGTASGAASIRTMQNLAHSLDPTRECTAAVNGSYGNTGFITVLDVKGFNYNLGSIDPYRKNHLDAKYIGTETASTVTTRGIYTNDPAKGYVAAYDFITIKKSKDFPNPVTWGETSEQWWSFYGARPWLSGGFAWTGFDYRGEPTPYEWPCINSHFGIMDMCGFPKDNFYYYQAWWTTNTVLHLLPHWNWAGKEGQEIRVDALSNCEEVELFLNGASLGKQAMKRNSKLTWQVKYAPGTLSAKGFNGGKVVAEQKIDTTGDATSVQLTPNRATINADGEDVSVLTVSVTDAQGRIVPVALNLIHFALSGAGKILGVGNGDPSSHEPDTFIAQPSAKNISFNDWRWKKTTVPARGASAPEYADGFDDSAWDKTSSESENGQLTEDQSGIFRQHLKLTADDLTNSINLHFGRIDDSGSVFVNGQHIGDSSNWEDSPLYVIKNNLHAGDNVIAVGVNNASGGGGLTLGVNVELVGQPVAPAWSRSVFNGLAQVIVQATKDAGEIKLTASAEGLKPMTVSIQSAASTPRPFVP
jgi:beta-galactosidase